MTTKWQRLSIDVPKDFKPAQREYFAQQVIDHIVKRTTVSGKDKNGKRFARYTKDYAKKKGSTQVDLVLTFDMLSSLQLLSERSGKVIVGFEKGSNANAKADGNIRGTYGQSTPIPGKARDFLGVQEKELDKIKEKVGTPEPIASEVLAAASRTQQSRRN